MRFLGFLLLLIGGALLAMPFLQDQLAGIPQAAMINEQIGRYGEQASWLIRGAPAALGVVMMMFGGSRREVRT